jgi:hypothetical protein
MGVAFVFGSAAWRLGERGVMTMRAGLGPWEWAALAGLTAVFVYGEGVRALQRKYIPFVLRRVTAVRHEHIVHRVLAPLHAMALVGAPPGILARSWGGSLAIVIAVLIVRGFAEPWRGIVDFAVASALSWATVALIVLAARSTRSTRRTEDGPSRG